MSIEIRDVLGDGVDRTFSRNGGILLGAVFLASVITQIGATSLVFDQLETWWEDLLADFPEFEEFVDDPEVLFPLAFDIPAFLALGLFVLGILLTIAAVAIAIRVFYSSNTSSIPAELIFDNIAWVVVNLFIGMVIFGVLWSVGLMLFIVPGIFIFVSLVYFSAVIAIEDRSFVSGLSSSWSLASGNRWDIFVLFLAYFLISIAVYFAFALVTSFVYLASPLAGQLIDILATSLLTVYFAAILAISYRRLTVGPAEPEDEGDPFEEFVPAGQNAQW